MGFVGWAAFVLGYPHGLQGAGGFGWSVCGCRMFLRAGFAPYQFRGLGFFWLGLAGVLSGSGGWAVPFRFCRLVGSGCFCRSRQAVGVGFLAVASLGQMCFHHAQQGGQAGLPAVPAGKVFVF